MLNLYVAPVQGHTDAAWRHFHQEEYGGDNVYFTPFIRLEHGEMRRHDLKDYTSPLNDGLRLRPQVIFRDMAELEPLISGLKDVGAAMIDLNCGCPFPLQTAKGRGAGFIANVEEFGKMPGIIEKFPEVEFSMKMRLGFSDPEEWRGVIDIINLLPLGHVTLHPRVARQQYGGELNFEQFEAFMNECRHPVVFNGEIHTPADIDGIHRRFPALAGVMTARGLLGRPSLPAEYAESKEWTAERRLEKMLTFHRRLLQHYESTLCGDSQVLSKIKPFWEYAEAEIGRKAWKQIKKASNMAKYNSAVALVGSDV